MDWGILQGLGQGLQQVGSMKMEQVAEQKRAELAEKLQQERERRDQLKFDPTQTTYKQVQVNGEPSPLWYEVRYNKAGEVIGQELASPDKVAEMEAESKQAGLKARLLEAQTSNAEYTGSRAQIEDAREDEEHNLLTPDERRRAAMYKAGLEVTPAQRLTADTSIQNAVTRGRGGSADSTDAPVTVTDAIINVVGKDKIEKYMQGPNALTPADIDEEARKFQREFSEAFARTPNAQGKSLTADQYQMYFLKRLDARKRAKAPAADAARPKAVTLPVNR